METTIAAISTAMSASGIGIVRISGENAMDVISRVYRSKGGKKKIIVLDTVCDEEVKNNCDYYFSFADEKLGEIEEVFAGLGYLVYGQLISLVKSAKLGINPDNPCPTGEVNRVVKGVIIHEYNK